jgi:hypothetical protein
MKVYRLTSAFSGKSFVDALPYNIAIEMNFLDDDYLGGNVKAITKKVQKLGIGDEWETFVWTLDCLEMSDDEYFGLPKFGGW